MVVAVENRASLKSWKMTVVALSLVAVVSTLYVYDDVVHAITDELSSRVLGYKRREKRAAYMSQPRRELVWVMSYPRGGADEIINFVERGTFTSMGTNYGDVLQGKDMQQYNAVHKSELVQKRWYSSGPFKNNVDFALPAEYGDVLVKTYCTGHCLHMENGKLCPRISYSRSLVNTDKFWSKCAGGSSYDPQRRPAVKSAKPYWRNRIKKVIVVVRNPLELVTNRWRDHMRSKGEKVSETNFRAYCLVIDAYYKKTKEVKTFFRKKWIKPLVDDVMCVTEFWRIAMWYSMAFAIARNRDPMIIYREDYVEDSQKTTTDVLKYIGMKQTINNLPNVNTGARLYFTDDEVAVIGNFINTAFKVDSTVWSHFKHYFEAPKVPTTCPTGKGITEFSITHVSGVRDDYKTWALNNIVALNADGQIVETSYKKSYNDHNWLPQSKAIVVIPNTTVKKIAFATQDAKEVIVGVTHCVQGTSKDILESNSMVVSVVHWSGQPRDGGRWRSEDGNDPTHWSYNFVDLDNLYNGNQPTTWSKLTSSIDKVITEFSITHVSGVSDNYKTWALNNIVALDAAGQIVETSYKNLNSFPQSKTVVVTPDPTVRKIAFATQDAKEVTVGVTRWVPGTSKDISETSNSKVLSVVHWSGQPRDGGRWRSEDNNDPTHWSYNFVDLDNLDSGNQPASWTKVMSNGE